MGLSLSIEPAFKALGGHRASHKKPRLMMGAGGDLLHHDDLRGSPAKLKTHECSICRLEFTIGIGWAYEEV
ncbi:hypothetical protein L1049_027018 [Liquidambar formosana]|uniref:C2H2-type domain-containing protein n=1 Tax=Liquidambar formosana TaxID=63359 RepID=A0AAP0NDQ3_LIQFO